MSEEANVMTDEEYIRMGRESYEELERERQEEMRRFKVKWLVIDIIAAAALAPILCWLFRLLEGIA